MSNTVPNEIVELVDNYQESGQPGLALRLQRIIPTLSAKEKEAIGTYVNISNKAAKRQEREKDLNFGAIVLHLQNRVAVVDKSNSEIYIVRNGAEKLKGLPDMADVGISAELVEVDDKGINEINLK